MRQYTTPEQTAKLIELGFAEPRSIRYPTNEEDAERVDSIDFLISDYSIGELISFLPDDGVSDKRLEFDGYHWFVDWDYFDKIHQTMQVELVDALFAMIVQLKEEKIL